MITQVILLIGGVGLGAFFSWYFTRAYYLRARKDSAISMKSIISVLVKRSIENVKELAEDKNKADEITKEIWTFLTERHGKDFLKHRCSSCGSEDIKVGFIQVGDGEVDIGYCGDCGEELW